MARTRARLTPTRRRRITARTFHYAARSGHLIATTLWITLLATGIALQFLWGITLGIAEGIGQLKKELRASKIATRDTQAKPNIPQPPTANTTTDPPKVKWRYR